MNRVNTTPSKGRPHRESEFSKVMKELGRNVLAFLKAAWRKIQEIAKAAGAGLKKLKQNFLRSFARWVDPKLEPYRERVRGKSEVVETPIEKEVVVNEVSYMQAAPETRDDLFALIREAPMSVLTAQERKAMTAVLSLPDVKVAEIMTPQLKMVFVNRDEMLGPLTLDKLYRSGFTYFPVVDNKKHIIGTLHTALLNSLDVKETQPAAQVMDPRVYYIRMDYSLEEALKAFLRTGSQLMLVVDHYERLVGMLTFAQVMDYLFSEKYRDDFDRDDDRLAVAKRKR